MRARTLTRTRTHRRGNATGVGEVRAELQDYSESVYRVNLFFSLTASRAVFVFTRLLFGIIRVCLFVCVSARGADFYSCR